MENKLSKKEKKIAEKFQFYDKHGKFPERENFLSVCHSNLDRSPAFVDLFENHPTITARSCGFYPVEEGTEINQELIDWADKIFLFDSENQLLFFQKFKTEKEVIVLGVENYYCRNDPELEKVLKIKLEGFL